MCMTSGCCNVFKVCISVSFSFLRFYLPLAVYYLTRAAWSFTPCERAVCCRGQYGPPKVDDLLQHDLMWPSGKQRNSGRDSGVRVWSPIQDHKGSRRRNRKEYLERQHTHWITLLWFIVFPSPLLSVSWIPHLPHSEFIYWLIAFCALDQYPDMFLQGFLTNRRTLVFGHNDPLWWNTVWVAVHQNSGIYLKHKPNWQQTTIP